LHIVVYKYCKPKRDPSIHPPSPRKRCQPLNDAFLVFLPAGSCSRRGARCCKHDDYHYEGCFHFQVRLVPPRSPYRKNFGAKNLSLARCVPTSGTGVRNSTVPATTAYNKTSSLTTTSAPTSTTSKKGAALANMQSVGALQLMGLVVPVAYYLGAN
jgi:hypothetical protein